MRSRGRRSSPSSSCRRSTTQRRRCRNWGSWRRGADRGGASRRWRSIAAAEAGEGIGATAGPGVIGSCATSLGIAPAALVDRRHALEVMLPHAGMTLTSADAAAIDRGANLALIGDKLVQFAEAVPLGGGRWRIAGLQRGRRGTDGAHRPARASS
ncbi:phage tail baseplate protein [Sphingomonas sp. MMS24-JH45]